MGEIFLDQFYIKLTRKGSKISYQVQKISSPKKTRPKLTPTTKPTSSEIQPQYKETPLDEGKPEVYTPENPVNNPQNNINSPVNYTKGSPKTSYDSQESIPALEESPKENRLEKISKEPDSENSLPEIPRIKRRGAKKAYQRVPGKLSTPEARREYQRRYYQLHKEKAKEYQRQYNLTHKKKVRGGKGKPGFICPREPVRTTYNSSDIQNSSVEKLWKENGTGIFSKIKNGEREYASSLGATIAKRKKDREMRSKYNSLAPAPA